jgi:DNA-binding MarR family transcriptional regulator
MSIFAAQYIRDKTGLSWGEDYVLGLIDSTAPTIYSRIAALVNKQNAVTSASANKYLKSLVEKGLVLRASDKKDLRLIHYTLTTKGEKIMKELKNAVK